MKEIITLYKEGKIRHIGISNFNLEECKQAKLLLDKSGIPLYGVQNHYSIISRTWEQNGLLDWCRENGVSFWAWAVLEEGLLTDPRIRKKGVMHLAYARQVRKMKELYKIMIKVANRHKISVPQVAMAFCHTKGIVPICGCRKPYQVTELAESCKINLTSGEIKQLEEAADQSGAKIMGPDLFRPFVLKNKKKKKG